MRVFTYWILSDLSVGCLECKEGRLIGQNVGVELLCHDEAGAHAGVGRGVPLGVGREGIGLCGDAENLRPEGKLLGVRAGAVTAGDEGILSLRDHGKGVEHTGYILDTCGVCGRSAQHEVVVQEAQALGRKALNDAGKSVGNKGFLLCLGVDEEHIGVAGLGSRYRLACAGRLHLDGVAVLLLKLGQQVAEQAGVLDGGGGGQTDGLGLLSGGGDLTLELGGAVLQVEQSVAEVLDTVAGFELVSFSGEQPVDEGFRSDGVDGNIGYGVAVCIGEGGSGIDGDESVVVDHVVIRFFEDTEINSWFVCPGTDAERRHHQDCKEQCDNLFH